MCEVGEEIKIFDEELRVVEFEFDIIFFLILNILYEFVLVGEIEDDNIEVCKWGEKFLFVYELKLYWDIVDELGILDFECVVKVIGSCFVFYKGLGVCLECVFYNFMFDFYVDEYNYIEVILFYMVNCVSMMGMGQFFKFEEDVFKIREEDYFLILIVEVLIINMYWDEIFLGDSLLINYVVFSVCFCLEVGLVGCDICGLICQY